MIAANYALSHPVLLAAGEGATRKTALFGIKDLYCWACPSRLWRDRGCHLEGRSYPARARMQIDHTGEETWDFIHFCPASVRDPSLIDAIHEAEECLADGGPWYRYGVPMAQLTEAEVAFLDDVRAVQARFRAGRDARHETLLEEAAALKKKMRDLKGVN